MYAQSFCDKIQQAWRGHGDQSLVVWVLREGKAFHAPDGQLAWRFYVGQRLMAITLDGNWVELGF